MMQKSNIRVSIICLAYNHEKYISSAIEGFLMQKTDFDFEIVVHDDASTDNTVKIIKSYQSKYPDKIKTILQSENQYSKVGFRGIFSQINAVSRGDYYAFCEADDYWIDSLKLQKQYDIITKDSSITLVYTNIDYHNVGTGKVVSSFLTSSGRHISRNFADHLFSKNYIAPCSWLFKRDLLSVGDQNCVDATFVIALEAFIHGTVFFLDEVTSVYRCLRESASHSRSIEKWYKYFSGVNTIANEYIERYPHLLEGKDIQQFYKTWYSTAFMMYYMKDISAFNAARVYFKDNRLYKQQFIYSLPKPILSLLVGIKICFFYQKYILCDE